MYGDDVLTCFRVQIENCD